MSHYSKLLNLKRGSWEPQGIARSPEDPGLVTGSGRGRESYETEPLSERSALICVVGIHWILGHTVGIWRAGELVGVGKKKNLHTFGVRSAGSKNSSWRRRRNPPLILHFTHVTGSKSRGSTSPRGPGSNAADGRCQHLQCFAPSRNTSMCICISSSWQPFEIGAIFVSISISSYIILFSDVKCFLPLKQKPVRGFVGIQTK